MLWEYSHTNAESLAQIRTITAKIQHFFSRGLFFIGAPCRKCCAVTSILCLSSMAKGAWLYDNAKSTSSGIMLGFAMHFWLLSGRVAASAKAFLAWSVRSSVCHAVCLAWTTTQSKLRCSLGWYLVRERRIRSPWEAAFRGLFGPLNSTVKAHSHQARLRPSTSVDGRRRAWFGHAFH